MPFHHSSPHSTLSHFLGVRIFNLRHWDGGKRRNDTVFVSFPDVVLQLLLIPSVSAEPVPPVGALCRHGWGLFGLLLSMEHSFERIEENISHDTGQNPVRLDDSLAEPVAKGHQESKDNDYD